MVFLTILVNSKVVCEGSNKEVDRGEGVGKVYFEKNTVRYTLKRIQSRFLSMCLCVVRWGEGRRRWEC